MTRTKAISTGYKYVDTHIDRHGNIRHYFRRGGKRGPRLPDPSDPTFVVQYANALVGGGIPIHQSTPTPSDRTMAALGHLYLRSVEFANLKESTQDRRRRVVEYVVQRYGHLPVAGATADDVRMMIMERRNTPGNANILRAALSVLFEFAMSQEPAWRETNPVRRIPKLALGQHRAWTDAELAKFEARWPLGTIQRTLFAVLLYTGQRRSGVHPMRWEDISGDVIRVEKQKQRKMRRGAADKSRLLWIPIHPHLREALKAWPKTGPHLFNSSKGTLYCSKMLDRALQMAVKGAGLSSKCVAHGLRKSAARLLAEAGCSAREIMAITGHETLEQVEFYTEAVSQTVLAKQAMAKFETRR